MRRLSMYFRPCVLQWYVVWEFLKNFSLALLACGLIVLLGTVIQKSTEFETYGISYGQIAFLSPFFLPQALTYALPLAVMIGAIMAYGRMAAENEVLAAQSGGASVGMISVYVLFVSLVLSFVSVWCNDQGIEWGYSCIRDHVINYRNPQFMENIEKPGSSLSLPLEQNTSVTINMLPRTTDPKSGKERRPIHIAFFSNDRTVRSFYASDHHNEPPLPNDHGGLSMKITLYHCQSVNDDQVVNVFEEIALRMDLPPLDDKFSLGKTIGTESFITNLRESDEMRRLIRSLQDDTMDQAADLAAQIAAGSPADPVAPLMESVEWMETRLATETVNGLREKSRKRQVEFHRKLSLSFIAFSMAILGIGLGLLVRKGQRMVGFVLGVLAYFLLYYPLMIILKETANAGVLPPWIVWAPNLILISLGFVLWRMFDRGHVPAVIVRFGQANVFARAGSPLTMLRETFLPLVEKLPLGRLTPFRRKADQHVVQQFLTPLVAVALAVGIFIITLDLVEHGNDVIKGIVQADQPVAGLLPRTVGRAIADVCVYYGVRALSIMFDLMPVMLLIAGGLAVTVMVRNNEHLIFKASGTPLQRVFLPMVLVAGTLSIGVTVLRESVMPGLLMEVDRLKPYVYHRGAKTLSMAGQTRDAENRNVVYEMGAYNRNKHECDFLRIYRIDEDGMTNGRVTRVSADRAVWDNQSDSWRLKTEIADAHAVRRKQKKREKEGPRQEAPKKETHYADHGLAISSTPAEDPLGLYMNTCLTAPVAEWKGTMSPSFLDSESLGPGVVRLSDLWVMRDAKPEFRSELWRRGFEWVTGILLVMISVPLLVRGEVRSLLTGVAWCVGLGAAYLVLVIVVSELAHAQVLPNWAPVLPHAAFLVLAGWFYGLRMQT
ncbi:MAG: LptF/LptG family permease [Planctomycetota bacterium]|nr:LptF/LptG family permease [Planctomycetota bacterium]